MHSLGVYTDQCLASIHFAHFSLGKKNSARRRSGFFFFLFTSAFLGEPDYTMGTVRLPPIIIPFVLLSLLSDLLGLQRLSSEKTGVLRVLHERQEPLRG